MSGVFFFFSFSSLFLFFVSSSRPPFLIFSDVPSLVSPLLTRSHSLSVFHSLTQTPLTVTASPVSNGSVSPIPFVMFFSSSVLLFLYQFSLLSQSFLLFLTLSLSLSCLLAFCLTHSNIACCFPQRRLLLRLLFLLVFTLSFSHSHTLTLSSPV